LLAARDYTEARLREKLTGKGFSEMDAEETLARLISEGWVNDRRFAERFADAAMASGRYYGSRLRQEMRRRGLAADLVSEVLGTLMQEHDEGQDIQIIFQRRFSGFSFKSASDKEKRRAMGYLQRRGFGFSTIMQAMKGSDSD
jgi:regulatory protein